MSYFTNDLIEEIEAVVRVYTMPMSISCSDGMRRASLAS
jgi:hypothetical protein